MDGDGLACWWRSGGIPLSLYLVRATCHGRHLAHVYWTTGFLLCEDGTEQLQYSGWDGMGWAAVAAAAVDLVPVEVDSRLT